MKNMKRLLAVVLVVALVLTSLVLPIQAQDETDYSARPVITRQPISVEGQPFQRLTLRVEAYIPNGDRIGFQWYYQPVLGSPNILEGETSASLSRIMPPGSLGNSMHLTGYFVRVYNASLGTAGDSPYRVFSAIARFRQAEPTGLNLRQVGYFLAFLFWWLPVGLLHALWRGLGIVWSFTALNFRLIGYMFVEMDFWFWWSMPFVLLIMLFTGGFPITEWPFGDTINVLL